MQEALPDHRLTRVDARRLDRDQHLAVAGSRSRNLADLKHIDAAVGVELHSLAHGSYDRGERRVIPV